MAGHLCYPRVSLDTRGHLPLLGGTSLVGTEDFRARSCLDLVVRTRPSVDTGVVIHVPLVTNVLFSA